MPNDRLNEMKAYIGFGPPDADNLRSLAGDFRPLIPEIVTRFYDVLLAHPAARAVLEASDHAASELRKTQAQWLNELFDGLYDETYYLKRLNIGVVHVRVGLEQRFMVLGMELIWHEAVRLLSGAGIAAIDPKLRSLHKLLMLDLTIMLESYKHGYSEQIRSAERSAVAEKLTRAEHLAEIGQLAASLAHEIKNPLAGISGAIQIIGEEMSADNPHRTVVAEIQDQISRLDATVKDLLQYARPAPSTFRDFQFEEIVSRVLTVLREEPALAGVRVSFSPSAEPTTLCADEGQIEHMVINLILNAAQASRRGGNVRLLITRLSDRARLAVEDDGQGMSQDVLDQAMQPFFTTKAKGTGLGLSICKRTAESHGGRIDVSSRVGQGTSVIVEIPYRPTGKRNANHDGTNTNR